MKALYENAEVILLIGATDRACSESVALKIDPAAARQVMRRCAELGAISEKPGG